MSFRIPDWLSTGEGNAPAKIESIFSGRTPLDDEQFYEKYFGVTDVRRDVAIGVRRAFLDNIKLDMLRLAPDDDFKKGLNFVWKMDSLSDVELILQIEKQFDIKISGIEGRDASTLGDMVRLVDRKVRAKNV